MSKRIHCYHHIVSHLQGFGAPQLTAPVITIFGFLYFSSIKKRRYRLLGVFITNFLTSCQSKRSPLQLLSGWKELFAWTKWTSSKKYLSLQTWVAHNLLWKHSMCFFLFSGRNNSLWLDSILRCQSSVLLPYCSCRIMQVEKVTDG